MRVPSRRVDTRPAVASARRWNEVLATDCPISPARSSTWRSPWARTSISSARRPLAIALATSAKPSYSASLRARSPITPLVFKESLDNLRRWTRLFKNFLEDVRMHVHAFVDEGLGHSSYLVDLGDGTAALVDPPRFPSNLE